MRPRPVTVLRVLVPESLPRARPPFGVSDGLAVDVAARSEVLEHAMRLVGDDLLVAGFACASPGSRAFLSCLGRLLEQCPSAARFGTPLFGWAASAEVSSDWRSRVPPLPGSLWGELDLLVQLTGGVDWTAFGFDPMEALFLLRQRNLTL